MQRCIAAALRGNHFLSYLQSFTKPLHMLRCCVATLRRCSTLPRRCIVAASLRCTVVVFYRNVASLHRCGVAALLRMAANAASLPRCCVATLWLILTSWYRCCVGALLRCGNEPSVRQRCRVPSTGRPSRAGVLEERAIWDVGIQPSVRLGRRRDRCGRRGGLGETALGVAGASQGMRWASLGSQAAVGVTGGSQRFLWASPGRPRSLSERRWRFAGPLCTSLGPRRHRSGGCWGLALKASSWFQRAV